MPMIQLYTLIWKILIQITMNMKLMWNCKKSVCGFNVHRYIWLKKNKLSLNIDKTKLMIFHRQQKMVKELNITINGTIIERVQSFNFLGITLSESMSWANHLLSIKKKISKVIGILYRLKNTFPLEVLKTLYKSLVLSYINYGLLYYGVSK